MHNLTFETFAAADVQVAIWQGHQNQAIAHNNGGAASNESSERTWRADGGAGPLERALI